MQGTDEFKKTIESYLEDRAKIDDLFAKSYAKDEKNIDDCIKYIINAVQKIGRQGFTDGEVFSMAVHYYDESDIKAGDIPANVSIVVNHVPKITEEDKILAKKQAMQELIGEQKTKMTSRKKATKTEESKIVQQSLF